MILNLPISEVKRSGEVFKELRKAAAAEMVISREVEGNGGENHVSKRDGMFYIRIIYPIGGTNKYPTNWKRKIIFKGAIGMRYGYVFSKGTYTVYFSRLLFCSVTSAKVLKAIPVSITVGTTVVVL